MDAKYTHLSLLPSPGDGDRRSDRYGGRRRHFEESFTCKHCHATVQALPMLSGVHNRNHCPYCLHSRHVDWRQAGDRLSACKAIMQPIGLAMKPARNKYAHHHAGELMLVHRCSECGWLSINRIAADDTAEGIVNVLHASTKLDLPTRQELGIAAIHLLGESEAYLVKRQLFGSPVN